MSELRETLNLQEQVTRIDRAIAETHKFMAEQTKLIAERQKLDCGRARFPWLQLLTLVVSSATIGALVARLLH
jgi:hypothetical protein